MTEPGLYIVATPIGNLEDITLRAIRVLRDADVIAAEDTRRTRALLSALEIPTPEMMSLHAYNEHGRCARVLDRVEAGLVVAAVSDAGTPAIADPGFLLVREALARGIAPVTVPGVSALTFAAAAAGIPVDEFVFAGFPPVKSGKRQKYFARHLACGESVFFYESPHRVAKTLGELRDAGGGGRRCAVIREATKLHEEILRGTVAEMAEKFSGDAVVRGEFVIAVAKESARESKETGDKADFDLQNR